MNEPFGMGATPSRDVVAVVERLDAINTSIQNLNQTLQTLLAMARQEIAPPVDDYQDDDPPRRVGT